MGKIKIRNFIQLNDWPIRDFLLGIGGIQVLIWLFGGLDALDINAFGIQQIISFIYILFVPGLCLLRILKLHKLGTIKTLLYAIGLSIGILMLLGLFINSVLPFFGIDKPISYLPVTIASTAIVVILGGLAYGLDRDYNDPDYLDLGKILSPQALALCLVPFISIFGTYFNVFYTDNRMLVALIVVIGIIALAIGFWKNTPSYVYPLAVFVIGLALVFHNSLITNYIFGADVQEEYYVANTVIQNGIWKPDIALAYNTSLFLTTFTSMSAVISGIDITWIFKAIYPALLSLIPVALYMVYRKGTDNRIAFYACFLFILTAAFYVHLPQLSKQIAATFYITLLIMLVTDTQMVKGKRLALILFFTACMVVSHYAMTYIFIGYLLVVWLLMVILDSSPGRKFMGFIYRIFNGRKYKPPEGSPSFSLKSPKILTFNVIIFAIVIAVSWYYYIASSVAFTSFIGVFVNIQGNIFKDIVNLTWVESVVATTQQSHAFLRILEILVTRGSHFFIGIGVVVAFLRPGETRFSKEYSMFTLPSLFLFLGTISLPFLSEFLKLPLAGGFDLSRLNHVTLIFLAPFCVIGGIMVIRAAAWVLRLRFFKFFVRNWSMVLSVFFVILFLFQAGFVWYTVYGASASRPFSWEWTAKYGKVLDKAYLYAPVLFQEDVDSAVWLSANAVPGKPIYGLSSERSVNSLNSYGMIWRDDVWRITSEMNSLAGDSYVYLHYLNIVIGVGAEYYRFGGEGNRVIANNINSYAHLWRDMNKIYTNGGSEIYESN